jgi:metallo-beta-lactamase family protein
MSHRTEGPEIIHHGAVNGVTGSCHQYCLSRNYSILVDCGLFQGAETAGSRSVQHLAFDFPVSEIKALLVTHVHIDHVGRIPYLFAAGFAGPIYLSEASAKLLPLVIEDAMKVGVTRNERLIAQFLALVESRMVAVPYGKWVRLPQSGALAVRVKFKPAGHILGSAYIEVQHQRPDVAGLYKTVFSGDLGASYSPLLPKPKSPYSANELVIESTYGDRNHEGRKQRADKLARVIKSALQDNGSVLIPAFSIGRTQELLYELENILHRMRGQAIHKNLNWDQLQIIVDSPLAAKFTSVVGQLSRFWDAEARRRLRSGRHPLSFEQLHTVETHEQHLSLVNYLAHTRQPAIVLAASGMCEGGRILNYLKAMLGDPAHQVLFVGYQARGTIGAAIQTYGPRGGWVEIDGARIDIRAGIETLSGYSAHAGQADLLQFIKGMRKKPDLVRIVHGDEDAKVALMKKVEALGVRAIIGR